MCVLVIVLVVADEAAAAAVFLYIVSHIGAREGRILKTDQMGAPPTTAVVSA